MNIVLYIWIILFFAACSSTRPRQRNRVFDSTVVTKDSINIRTHRDSAGMDSITYHKRVYNVEHSPAWRNRYAWWQLAVVVIVALTIIILKAK